MIEHPILFNAEMVRAILNGKKTQTRRVFKLPKDHEFGSDYDGQIVYQKIIGECSIDELACPYGQTGDSLWVRETCRAEELPYSGWEDGVRYLADDHWRVIENTKDAADAWVELNSYRGKKGAVVPSIHMPRWASRILLEITNVSVERLNEISESDAKSEGVYLHTDGNYTNYLSQTGYALNAKSSFLSLWESINGPDSCDANPWVWVIEFKVIELKGGV